MTDIPAVPEPAPVSDVDAPLEKKNELTLEVMLDVTARAKVHRDVVVLCGAFSWQAVTEIVFGVEKTMSVFDVLMVDGQEWRPSFNVDPNKIMVLPKKDIVHYLNLKGHKDL